jgi:dipeptidyl aminopeptidase/acylaminoacyl peptidase
MPWDGTELLYAEFDSSADYKDYATLQPKKIAGAHSSVSINDVKWDVFGTDKLYYLSDETGYTNLWSIDLAEPDPSPKLVMEPIPNDLSEPLWRLAPSWYAILSANTALIAPNICGIRRLRHLDVDTGRSTQIKNEYCDITGLHRLSENRAAFLAGKWDEPIRIVIVTLGSCADTATFGELVFAKESRLPDAHISRGECMSLPIMPKLGNLASSPDKSRDIHVVLYPPTNPDFTPLKGELPPAIVMVHGGPTARAPPGFSIFHQYFTTRGFAVIDVNYGGSSGYGREYHRRLYGGWGVVDVQDTIRAVEELGKLGKLDSKRVCIRGSSAGKKSLTLRLRELISGPGVIVYAHRWFHDSCMLGE